MHEAGGEGEPGEGTDQGEQSHDKRKRRKRRSERKERDADAGSEGGMTSVASHLSGGGTKVSMLSKGCHIVGLPYWSQASWRVQDSQDQRLQSFGALQRLCR